MGPGRNAALFRGQRAPAPGDAADVIPVKLLVGGAGTPKAPVLARDIAVTALEIDDRALPDRLGNGADFLVVSGTRLLRWWFPRPQSGGCSEWYNKLLGGGKLKSSANQFFTTETGSSRNGHDETNGFISGREPLAYHPKTGR